jgi:hypothetical protein
MRFVSKILFLVPLSIHIGYFGATFPELFMMIGRTGVDDGTPKGDFALFWVLTIALANVAFIALYFRLPKMRDRMLKVPGQAFWLANEEQLHELVQRLRGILEAALLGQNLFFLAVYQSIYQVNSYRPAVRFELPVLIAFFMMAPLLMVAVVGLLTIRGLALDADKDR